MNNSIYVLKDYGKVEITLKEVLIKKGISRNKLCRYGILWFGCITIFC